MGGENSRLVEVVVSCCQSSPSVRPSVCPGLVSRGPQSVTARHKPHRLSRSEVDTRFST